jgi:pantothenate kinase
VLPSGKLGAVHLLNRLRAGDDVFYPTFDRAADCAVPDDARIVLFEGNYLLPGMPP